MSKTPTQTFIDFLKSQTIEEIAVEMIELQQTVDRLKTAQQEPVAVVETIGGYPDESAHVAKWLVPYKSLKAGDKLYTTPPQRKPLPFDEQEMLRLCPHFGPSPARDQWIAGYEAAQGIKGEA